MFAAEQPTTVFLNGNFYTGADPQPRAEAIAVSHDRIVFVGSTADARKNFADAKLVDLNGKTVVTCSAANIGETSTNSPKITALRNKCAFT